MPYILPTLAIRLVHSARSIYISDLWEELAILLVDKATVKTAEDALYLIERGEFNAARSLIEKGKEVVNENRLKSELQKMQDEYPDAKQEELQLLLRVFRRFEEDKINNLGNMRKDTESLVKIAKASEKLEKEAFAAVFKSARNRKMFAVALEKPEVEDLIFRLNNLGKNEHAEEAVAFELQQHLETFEALARQKTRRIVLIAGENVLRTIERKLVEQTGIELKVMEESGSKLQRLRSIIGKGDVVVIETSHIGHSASGNAAAVCKTKGVPYLLCNSTNAERILQRLRQ